MGAPCDRDDNASRYGYLREHVSVILTDDCLHIAGLRIELFYEEPRDIPLTGVNTSDALDEAIDLVLSAPPRVTQ